MLHLYAAFAYNLDARTIGILATGASCTSIPVGFTAGWMMDRFGRKWTMVPGFTGVTIAMALLALTAFVHAPFWVYVPVFLVTVVTQALTGSSIQTVGADVAPATGRATFLGVYRLTGQIGTALAPIGFALLADNAGYGYSFAFLSAAAGIVAYLLLTRIPETGSR